MEMPWRMYIVLGSVAHFSLPTCPYLSSFCLPINMLHESCKGGKRKESEREGNNKENTSPKSFFFFYQNVAAVEAASFPACRMKVSPFFFFHKDHHQTWFGGLNPILNLCNICSCPWLGTLQHVSSKLDKFSIMFESMLLPSVVCVRLTQDGFSF